MTTYYLLAATGVHFEMGLILQGFDRDKGRAVVCREALFRASIGSGPPRLGDQCL